MSLNGSRSDVSEESIRGEVRTRLHVSKDEPERAETDRGRRLQRSRKVTGGFPAQVLSRARASVMRNETADALYALTSLCALEAASASVPDAEAMVRSSCACARRAAAASASAWNPTTGFGVPPRTLQKSRSAVKSNSFPRGFLGPVGPRLPVVPRRLEMNLSKILSGTLTLKVS